MGERALAFARLELRADHAAAAVVANRGREVDRRDSERGAELDDGTGAQHARRDVEQPPRGGLDWNEGIREMPLQRLERPAAAHPIQRHARRRAQEVLHVSARLAVEASQQRRDLGVIE